MSESMVERIGRSLDPISWLGPETEKNHFRRLRSKEQALMAIQAMADHLRAWDRYEAAAFIEAQLGRRGKEAWPKDDAALAEEGE